MESLQTFLTQYSGIESYLVFFFVVVVSCIGLFNSDITFITAGALSSIQFFDVRILIAVGFVALMIGDSITFFVGRRWGRTIIRKKPFSLVLSDQKMDAAESFLAKKGKMIISFVRFLPLLRTALFLSAGSLKVKPKYFYSLNAFSSLIYLPIVILASARASSHAKEIVAGFKKFQLIPITLLAVLILFFLIKKNYAKKESSA